MTRQFRDNQLEHWQERLNAIIPFEVNGSDTEGERMVEFEYHPNSVRITHYEIAPEDEVLTLCYLTVDYLVERREAIGALLLEPRTLHGIMCVPVDNGGALILDDVHWLDGFGVPSGTRDED